MNLTDLCFFPNAKIKTLDGIGVIAGIPNYNSPAKTVMVRFDKIEPKKHCQLYGKLTDYWATVNYAYYILNKNTQILLRPLTSLTRHDMIALNYDPKVFPLDVVKRRILERRYFEGFTPDEMKILCLLNFDVFGWLEKVEEVANFNELNSVLV